MVYVLSYGLGLRMWIQPESTHSSWNDVKNSCRRSNFQHCLLLATVMSNMAHGPYRSGRNKCTIQEAAKSLVQTMSHEEFNDLVDRMAIDRAVSESEDDSLPDAPEQILDLPAIKNLPVYVAWLLQLYYYILHFFSCLNGRIIVAYYLLVVIPETKTGPNQPYSLLTQVKSKSWFASVAVMHHLCDNWSLMEKILDHVFSFQQVPLRHLDTLCY